MCCHFLFGSKVRPNGLPKVQYFLKKTRFFYKTDIFPEFCIRKKNHEISVFRKMAEKKRGGSGLIGPDEIQNFIDNLASDFESSDSSSVTQHLYELWKYFWIPPRFYNLHWGINWLWHRKYFKPTKRFWFVKVTIESCFTLARKIHQVGLHSDT